MCEKRIQIEPGSRLTLVEMAGNVAVESWDEAEVLLRLPEGKERDLTVEATEAGPAVSAQTSCEVWVPAHLPVTVRQALGNLKVRGIADLNAEQVRGHLKLSEVGRAVVAEVYGHLKAAETDSLRVVGTVYGDAGLEEVSAADLQNVRGNLQIRESEQVRASRIGGNLQAREIAGDLEADQVGGNAVLKNIGGRVALDRVAGNLVARQLTGGARAGRVGGNLTLNGELGVGCSYHFQVDGNAALRLPEEANAYLTLTAEGAVLSSIRLIEEVRTGRKLSGRLGEGGAEIALEAGGNILLGGGGAAMHVDLGEEISRQVEEGLRAIDLEAIGRRVGEEVEQAMSRLRVKLESVDWDRIGRQTQQAIERAMERMQRDAERMAERAARYQERMERRAEKEARRAERWGPKVKIGEEEWQVGEPDRPPESGPSLDEERLSILKMVEQGQITPAEAELLLDALE